MRRDDGMAGVGERKAVSRCGAGRGLAEWGGVGWGGARRNIIRLSIFIETGPSGGHSLRASSSLFFHCTYFARRGETADSMLRRDKLRVSFHVTVTQSRSEVSEI